MRDKPNRSVITDADRDILKILQINFEVHEIGKMGKNITGNRT